MNTIRLNNGKVMLTPGGLLTHRDSASACCCKPSCFGCEPDSRDIPAGYTATLAGWQMPTCWGPLLMPTWTAGVTHVGGSLNGTFDIPRRTLVVDGTTYCHFASDPIPFELRQFYWNGGACDAISPHHIPHVNLVIARFGGLRFVAQGVTGTGGAWSCNPIFWAAGGYQKCSQTISFSGPATEPTPPEFEVGGTFDCGVWGGTVVAVPYW